MEGGLLFRGPPCIRTMLFEKFLTFVEHTLHRIEVYTLSQLRLRAKPRPVSKDTGIIFGLGPDSNVT